MRVPVLRPQLPRAQDLIPYLDAIDATRYYSNHGPLTMELARRLGGLFRLPANTVSCTSSGTAAITAAILATVGRARSERPLAILPAFTFVATAAAIEQCGYRPYLVDIEVATWMLDPDRLPAHPLLRRVGVVVPVGAFGRPVPQRPWQEFARKTGVSVVIDGAAGFEASIERPDETIGRLPVALSFHATKTFSTGEGGAVVTTDTALSVRALQTINFGFHGTRDSTTASFNGKMSEYHAAVGLAEFDRLDLKLAAFREVAKCYRELMREAQLSRGFFGWPETASNYILFLCRSPTEAAAVQKSLDRSDIDFRLWYGVGLHRHSYYRDFDRDQLPNTDTLAPRLLGLPVAPDLTEADIRRVVTAIAEGVDGG